ncbi:MAG TPA: hypothetical protein VGB17_10715 [Pyrinomonadaceae bacterium]
MMRQKLQSLFLIFAMMLTTLALFGARPEPSRAAARTVAASGSDMLSQLPPSDAVIFVDAQKVLTDAVPAVLAVNPNLLLKLNAEIEKFKTETGVDPRTFESVAVGLKLAPGSLSNFSMVFIVRGSFESKALIEAGFAAAAKRGNKLPHTEQEYKGKTLFVVGPAKLATAPAPNAEMKTSARVVVQTRVAEEKAVQADGTKKMETPCAEPSCGPVLVASAPAGTREADVMAVTALDSNTFAAGDLESVKATVDAAAGGAHVDDEMVKLATRTTGALLGFSGRLPAAAIKELGSSFDPQAKNVAGVREFYGSLTLAGTDAEALLNLRTENAEQAHNISQMILSFKLLDGANYVVPGPNGRLASPLVLLQNLSVTNEGAEVQTKLKLTQADLAPFLK